MVKACDYYGVSADYLLGRTLTRDGTTIGTEELYDISDEKDNSMRGSVLALLSKKLLVNSIGMLFDLLGKTGSPGGHPGGVELSVHRPVPGVPPPVPRQPRQQSGLLLRLPAALMAGLADADLHMSEVELTDALAAHMKEKGRMPEMDHAALARDYPVLYQSMLQLIHNSGERINQLMEGRKGK